MPLRFAMKITENMLEMARQVTGSDTAILEDDTYYIVIEALSDTKFTGEIMTENSVFEEYKTNSELHIM